MVEHVPTAPAAPAALPAEDSLAQQVFRTAVDEVARRAVAALPTCKGRIAQAVKLVLAGDVQLLPDGTATVASQSNSTVNYVVVNGECSCPDFAKAPEHQCKHRLARGIQTRAVALAVQRLEALNTPRDGTAEASTPQTLPVAPAAPPAPSIPAQFLVELHGKQFVTFGGLLAMAHERGLQRLEAHFVSVTAELALAEATATFADGRTFTEAADASPKNVNKQVAPHFPRCALTRAKARALRDALNISTVAIEELEA
jgi:hypothetical protein